MANDIILFDKEQAIERARNYNDIVVSMREKVLRKGHDYGVIPGTGNKPTLLKPGAERLCSAFGFAPEFDLISSVENWDTDKPLFNYKYKCTLRHIDSGKVIATGIGSCNSMEKKYRWRNVPGNEAQRLGYDLAELSKNKWGKYQVPNDDIYSQVNTIDKMACKRALVAAVLIGCNASDHFTQDIEDMRHMFTDDIIEGEVTEVSKPTSKKQKKEEQEPEPWPCKSHIDTLFAGLFAKGLTQVEILKFAEIDDKYDLAQWKKFDTGSKAWQAIEKAWNAEMEATPPATVKGKPPEHIPDADIPF
jgi:hypothetical protein